MNLAFHVLFGVICLYGVCQLGWVSVKAYRLWQKNRTRRMIIKGIEEFMLRNADVKLRSEHSSKMRGR